MASAIASTDTMPVTAAPATIPHVAADNAFSMVETCAMLVTGLGLMGIIARRRQGRGYRM